jgi:hypothetical protein
MMLPGASPLAGSLRSRREIAKLNRRLACTSAAWLLPLMLTACFHKTQQAQVRALAPPLVDAQTKPPPPSEVPPPLETIPTQPKASVTALPQQAPPQVHHKKPVIKNTEEAANQPPPAPSGSQGVSAIGQLSSGDPTDFERQTQISIASTDRGLNALTRRLNDQERKTAVQIREFLKEARTALASGDDDGAHTLAVKAKVLLSELIH